MDTYTIKKYNAMYRGMKRNRERKEIMKGVVEFFGVMVAMAMIYVVMVAIALI